MTKAFACYHHNKQIQKGSSSGGMFYALAEWTIQQDGVVFGAKLDSNWEVVHSYCERIEDISSFMTSKYVQSSMGNSFAQVKKFLQEKRWVLFSGTPCQVAGLKSFLGGTFERLICVDFICHGVPSRRVWREYLEAVCQKHKLTIRDIHAINFRDKSNSWTDYSLKIQFSGGNNYQKSLQKDLYLKGFLQNIFLRPSCYECRFKSVERPTDITLADFWGVKDINPEMYQHYGTSLFLLHSEKGETIWNAVKTNYTYSEVALDKAVAINSAAILSVPKPSQRALFFSLNDKEITKRITRTIRVPLWKKIARKSKKVIIKFCEKKKERLL